jgi:hypothetical protein
MDAGQGYWRGALLGLCETVATRARPTAVAQPALRLAALQTGPMTCVTTDAVITRATVAVLSECLCANSTKGHWCQVEHVLSCGTARTVWLRDQSRLSSDRQRPATTPPAPAEMHRWVPGLLTSGPPWLPLERASPPSYRPPSWTSWPQTTSGPVQEHLNGSPP